MASYLVEGLVGGHVRQQKINLANIMCRDRTHGPPLTILKLMTLLYVPMSFSGSYLQLKSIAICMARSKILNIHCQVLHIVLHDCVPC